MKLSLKKLLLLVATAALGSLSATQPVEYKPLEGDVAAVEAVPMIPAATATDETLRATDENLPADAEVKSQDVKKESRFIRTGAKIFDFIIKNRAAVVKRIARDIIFKLFQDHLAPQLTPFISHKDKVKKNVLFNVKNEDGSESTYQGNGIAAPQGEAAEPFRKIMIEQGLKSIICGSLDASIKTDQDHWALSAGCAALFELAFESGDWRLAIVEAFDDYFYSPDFAEHLGKHAWAYYILPFFLNGIKDGVKEGIKKDQFFDSSKPNWTKSAIRGVGFNLGGFLAFNPKTRVPTYYAKNTFVDSFVKNFIGRALIPGFLGFLTTKHGKAVRFDYDKDGNAIKYTKQDDVNANPKYIATLPSKPTAPVFAYKNPNYKAAATV